MENLETIQLTDEMQNSVRQLEAELSQQCNKKVILVACTPNSNKAQADGQRFPGTTPY